MLRPGNDLKTKQKSGCAAYGVIFGFAKKLVHQSVRQQGTPNTALVLKKF